MVRRTAAGDDSRGGTQEGVRRHNLGTLLGHLHLSGPLSRAELTARMGLNRSTIAALVAELAALGAVREERPAGGQSGAGRPSLVVNPRPEHVQVVAAEIGVDHVDVALMGLGGVVVARRHRRLQTSTPRPPRLVALLRRMVTSVLADPAAGELVVGLGVSLPGVVRRSDGCVRFAPNLGWTDEPFGVLLAREMPGLPVRVGNDADLGVLAEHRRGCARGIDDVVFVAGEVGVGGGFIVGGRPLLGVGGYAGEIGHIPVRPQGRRCRCGSAGCWETEIGAEAVARALGLDPAVADMTADDLRPALRAAEVSPGLEEVGHYLGVGLGTLVNVMNPRLLILGGLLRELYPPTQAWVRAGLASVALRAPADEVRLAVPELGGDAVLVGAAEMLWDDLLADPAAVLRAAALTRGRAGLTVAGPPARVLAGDEQATPA